ncbi:MAG: TIGR02996 domain-containing protein, partial [Planctomycetaceae bacterium]
MDEDTFLRDIRDDPDDLGPRLVFADWLEERGDSRAEFIRLDCEMADPDLDADSRRELKRTHQGLLQEQRQLCLARLQVLGVRDIRFWCGLVDRLLIEGTAFLDRPRTLFQVAPTIRGLMLRKIPPELASDAMRRLFRLPQLTCLSSLDVSGCGLAAGGAEALADSDRSRRLSHLNVSHNFLGGQGLRNLAVSPHLSQIRRLNLSGNQLGVIDMRELTRSREMGQLAHLVLATNQMGDAG